MIFLYALVEGVFVLGLRVKLKGGSFFYLLRKLRNVGFRGKLEMCESVREDYDGKEDEKYKINLKILESELTIMVTNVPSLENYENVVGN